MDRRESEALDRHITGNYGENQFRGNNECPWCGADIDGLVSSNYDSNLEAHTTECEVYLAEQKPPSWWTLPPEEWVVCQVSECMNGAADGVMCGEHMEPETNETEGDHE
jgi:hypothetical protein